MLIIYCYDNIDLNGQRAVISYSQQAQYADLMADFGGNGGSSACFCLICHFIIWYHTVLHGRGSDYIIIYPPSSIVILSSTPLLSPHFFTPVCVSFPSFAFSHSALVAIYRSVSYDELKLCVCVIYYSNVCICVWYVFDILKQCVCCIHLSHPVPAINHHQFHPHIQET